MGLTWEVDVGELERLELARARADEAAARARRETLEREFGRGGEAAPESQLPPPKRTPKPRRPTAVIPPSADELAGVSPLEERRVVEMVTRKGMLVR